MYVIKATWAGMLQEEAIARSLDEAELYVLGTEATEGMQDRFMRGGYDYVHQDVRFAPRVLCVDILRSGRIVRSFNFSR